MLTPVPEHALCRRRTCHAQNPDATALPVPAVDHPGIAPPAHLPGIPRGLRRAVRLRHPARGATPLRGDAPLAAHPSPPLFPALLRLQRLVALRRDGGFGQPQRRRELELGRVRGGPLLYGGGGGDAAGRAAARLGGRDIPPRRGPARIPPGPRGPALPCEAAPP